MSMQEELLKAALIMTGPSVLVEMQKVLQEDRYSHEQMLKFKESLLFLAGLNPDFIRGYICGMTEHMVIPDSCSYKIMISLVILREMDVAFLTGESFNGS